MFIPQVRTPPHLPTTTVSAPRFPQAIDHCERWWSFHVEFMTSKRCYAWRITLSQWMFVAWPPPPTMKSFVPRTRDFNLGRNALPLPPLNPTVPVGLVLQIKNPTILVRHRKLFEHFHKTKTRLCLLLILLKKLQM